MKTKSKNSVPQSVDPAISLCSTMLAAAETLSAEVGLEQNTAEKIAADHYALAGNPATPDQVGKQTLYNTAKAENSAARITLKRIQSDAAGLCRACVTYLKPALGYQWNGAWEAAGFSAGSVANPKDPLPALLELRGFFRTNPARENAPLGATAVAIEAMITQLQRARSTADISERTRLQAKQERDIAFRKVQRRITGVRKELEQLLSPEDPRWYDFGLVRPVDGKVPAVVTGLALRPGGRGEVIASWSRSRLAQNYRVRTMVAGAEGDPVQVALTPVLEVVIPGCVSGSKLRVYVSAVNAAGETVAAEQEITVA